MPVPMAESFVFTSTVPASSMWGVGVSHLSKESDGLLLRRVDFGGCEFPRLALTAAEPEDIPQRAVRDGGPETGMVSRVLEP